MLGDVQNELPDGRWTAVADVKRETVTVDAISRAVPVLPLRQLLVVYQNMGRPQTASLISAQLARADPRAARG